MTHMTDQPSERIKLLEHILDLECPCYFDPNADCICGQQSDAANELDALKHGIGMDEPGS